MPTPSSFPAPVRRRRPAHHRHLLRGVGALAGAATVLGLAAVAVAAGAHASSVAPGGYHKKTPPLSTPWTAQVGPDNALPEYPRPQLTRSAGTTSTACGSSPPRRRGSAPPFGTALAERILVPYPVESALSGIMRHGRGMWYRRTFTVPAAWHAGHASHLLLHFGAVDYDATVYVNGTQVAHHLGGYDRFDADVTGALQGAGPQEIVVGVYDPTDAGEPADRQAAQHPSGIFYTPTFGDLANGVDGAGRRRAHRLAGHHAAARAHNAVTVQAATAGALPGDHRRGDRATPGQRLSDGPKAPSARPCGCRCRTRAVDPR